MTKVIRNGILLIFILLVVVQIITFSCDAKDPPSIGPAPAPTPASAIRPTPTPEQSTYDAYAWTNKGNALLAQGKYDEAIQAYDKAIELNQEAPDLWISKGHTFYRQGKYDKALDAYDRAIELIPFADYWYSKGIALKALGRAVDADAAFAKAKELGYTGNTQADPNLYDYM
jgi:tetratricopeptide (TPR) repeat protein